MKRLAFSLFLLSALCGFVSEKNETFPVLKNDSFKRGEVLNFKMTYGFFTVGKGSMQISPQYFKMNGRDCFKIEVVGRTVGMVDWVADVNDLWGAYIDTAALVPHQFYRKIREGRYTKDEWTYFDQINKKIQVVVLDDKTGKLKEPVSYDAPEQVRDMFGGFMILRTFDISKIKPKDTLTISGFFEDVFYHQKIIFKGRETIKTKIGKVRTIVFIPIMPKNKVFDGENSVTAWFSDDKNRIPVKINAEMFIGSAGVELTSYSGLRNPLNLVK